MSQRVLSKLALLEAIDNCEMDKKKERSEALIEKNRRMLILACKYMEFRDPLLRQVTLSRDPGERKREAKALMRVKRMRKRD